jgi:hypothetical protein
MLFVTATVLALSPRPATAQFHEPCGLACIGVLTATSFVTATGAAVAAGRLTGGMSTVSQGLVAWGGAFAAMAGSAMALSGDGFRQERAVYGAGMGMLSGALAGLVLAGTLIGAALGAVAGGVYGAISYDDKEASEPMPLLSIGISF